MGLRGHSSNVAYVPVPRGNLGNVWARGNSGNVLARGNSGNVCARGISGNVLARGNSGNVYIYMPVNSGNAFARG